MPRAFGKCKKLTVGFLGGGGGQEAFFAAADMMGKRGIFTRLFSCPSVLARAAQPFRAAFAVRRAGGASFGLHTRPFTTSAGCATSKVTPDAEHVLDAARASLGPTVDTTLTFFSYSWTGTKLGDMLAPSSRRSRP